MIRFSSPQRCAVLFCVAGVVAMAAGCQDDDETGSPGSSTSATTGQGGKSTTSAGGAGGSGASNAGAGGSGAAGGGGGGGGVSNTPQLVAATFIGAPGSTKPGQNQSARNVLWSKAGDLVVAGLGGKDAPTTSGVYQESYAGDGNGPHQGLGGDCWIGRLSADLSTLTVATLYGGPVDERPCYGLAELANGTIVVAGQTHSASGIATNGALLAAKPSGLNESDGFVAVLSADLKTLIAGSYVGGAGDATMRGGVRLLKGGNLLAFGQVDGNGLGSSGAVQQTSAGGYNEAWLGALTPDLKTLSWGTYLGSGASIPTEVVVGTAEAADGDIVLLSSSASTAWLDNARTHGAIPTGGDASRPFVARLKPTSPQSLDWLTVLGPGEGNSVTGQSFQEAGMAMDGAGNVYVAGETSTDFGTPGAYQTTNQGGGDCFVCKVTPTGTLSWCTHVGTSNDETCLAPLVGPTGKVLVAGRTKSASLCDKAADVLQPAHGGGYDAFLAVIAADGSGLDWCTFLGGSGDEVARWLALSPSGTLALSGMTKSSDFPATSGAYDTSFNGGNEDMFVALYRYLPLQ